MHRLAPTLVVSITIIGGSLAAEAVAQNVMRRSTPQEAAAAQAQMQREAAERERLRQQAEKEAKRPQWQKDARIVGNIAKKSFPPTPSHGASVVIKESPRYQDWKRERREMREFKAGANRPASRK